MRIVLWTIGVLSFLATAPLRAECGTVAEPMARTPLEGRFNALAATDRYLDVPGSIVRWQALIDDAGRERGASPALVARSYGRLAWALSYVGRAKEALTAAQEGEHRIVAAGLQNQPYHVDVLTSLSVTEVDAGDVAGGARHADEALALVKARGIETADTSLAYNTVGHAAYSLGAYDEAERNYRLATESAIRCLPPSDSFIVNHLASHAGILYMLGRSEDALEENERAAKWALANLREDNPVITLTLGNLGVMLRSAGRYAEAEAALRRVVDLEARYQKESWYYRAISLSNFASVIDMQGRHREAEALWLTASDFHRRVTVKRDPVTQGYPLRFSADAAQARGDLALALSRRKEALAVMEADTAPDHPELARARIEYALTLTLLHRAAEGLKVAEPAIAVVRAKLSPDDAKRMTAEIAYARIVASVSGPEAGYAIAAPIAARLETRLLDTSTARGDLLRYGPAFSASFATVTDLALATKRDEAAFRWLQLANLSDIVLVSSEVGARAALGDAAGREQMRALQDRMRARQTLDRARSFAVSANDAAELARLDAAIKSNDAGIETAVHDLDRDYPTFRALARPEPVTLAAFRVSLRKGQALVAPLPVEDGTLAVVVTRDRLSWRKTGFARWTVAELVSRVREATANPSAAFPVDAAQSLYRAVLPDGARQPELLFYASGPLATVPPSLFQTPSKAWLIHDHSVTVLPALRLASATTPTTATRFLGVGTPDGSLPEAPRELARMSALLGGDSKLLLGAAASEAAVKQLPLDRYNVIAIATHGLAAGERPGLTEPALEVGAAAGEDGLLTASEIAGLRLDADWVILSACSTAEGMGAGAPAYSGLASAFMAAGARALLVSHWPVRDDAAEALTVATLKGTRAGLNRAEALRRAMLALMNDPKVPQASSPAVWAPFVLIER